MRMTLGRKWAKDLRKVLRQHGSIVDADFIASALDMYAESIIENPESYDHFDEGNLQDVSALLTDIRKLQWKWLDEFQSAQGG